MVPPNVFLLSAAALFLSPWATVASRNEEAEVSAHINLPTVGEGSSLEESGKAEAVAVPNVDRITCLRQDDLDLAVPHTDEQVVRMVLGVSGDTSSDIYVSVSDIVIKKLAATIKLKRKGTSEFYVEISGDEVYEGSEVASVDFKVKGCDVLIHSGWLDWAASQAADRKTLLLGQDGSLKFKITGTGRAKWNATIEDWEVIMTKQEASPFYFHISNQYILQKAVNRYGGIDELIMKALWPAVLQAIPRSLITSFTMLGPEDLSPVITIRASGATPEDGGQLAVHTSVDVRFDTSPSKLLEVLSENFDPATVAQKQMAKLIASVDLEMLWRQNKPTLVAILQRYGLNPEILDRPFDKDALEGYLLEEAKKRGDMFMTALQPFIDARKQGDNNLFEGLLVQNSVNGGWGADGLLNGSFAGPPEPIDGHDELLRLPGNFVLAVANLSKFAAPPSGQTSTIGHEAMTFEGSRLRVDTCKMKDMRVKSGGENGTAVQTWKLGGTIRDISLILPASWSPQYKLAWDSSETSLLPSHDWVVKTGARGLTVQQVPAVAVAASDEHQVQQPSPFGPKPRAGDPATLDGKVPDEYARPTQERTFISRTSLMPTLSSSASLEMKGAGSRLTLRLTAQADIKVALRKTLQNVLAPRPQVDFGYIFFSETFERVVVDGEEGLKTPVSVVAVVSCGYLRLLKPGWVPSGDESPLQRLDMDPKHGQLQIDLTQYTAAPTVETTPDGTCAVLYSSGLVSRKGAYGGMGLTGRWYKDAHEYLCGPKASVDKLVNAIGVQVQRFRADPARSSAWHFGTHDATEQPAQYPLPEGRETVSLTSLVDP